MDSSKQKKKQMIGFVNFQTSEKTYHDEAL